MLRVRGLSFRYPSGKLALVDFGLTVEPGELVVVLGGNGGGKTTLLRCITRTLRRALARFGSPTPIYVCLKGKSCGGRALSWR
jgi:ABC-type cobalamin/Fe3+-siderophores transport system ATPase subunit